MPATDQGSLKPEDAKALLRTLSADRFSTYMVAAGHDQVRAFKMYIWNAHIGEAFHTPIQAVEVALRNCLNYGIIREYGDDWWRNRVLETILDDERTGDLVEVLRRISNRNLTLCNGQVVAGLSFGFWVGMLQRRYNPPIWSRHLRHSFPFLPPRIGRDDILDKARKVATLRNRISHHEPLIKRDISADYANVMEFLGWLCPTKIKWIRTHCRVPEVLRQKP
jgi:hypothetical protein